MSSPEELITLAPSSDSAERDIPIYGPAPPAPTFRPASYASTSTCPVIPNRDLACPAPSALETQHSTFTLLNNVDISQRIKEALPYDDMAQGPYPPTVAPLAHEPEATAN